MAREDIIPQLIRQLMLKEGPPEEDNNSILQKMIIPVDRSTLIDSLTTSRIPTTARTWGTFQWSMSQWGSVQEKMLSPQDNSTLTDSMQLTKIAGGSNAWGNFTWGNNTWATSSGNQVGANNTWNAYQGNTWSSMSGNTWSSL